LGHCFFGFEQGGKNFPTHDAVLRPGYHGGVT
jgi:hypothetical protein